MSPRRWALGYGWSVRGGVRAAGGLVLGARVQHLGAFAGPLVGAADGAVGDDVAAGADPAAVDAAVRGHGVTRASAAYRLAVVA